MCVHQKIALHVKTFSEHDEKDERRENKYLPLSEFQTFAQLQKSEKTENFEIFHSWGCKLQIPYKWVSFMDQGHVLGTTQVRAIPL